MAAGVSFFNVHPGSTTAARTNKMLTRRRLVKHVQRKNSCLLRCARCPRGRRVRHRSSQNSCTITRASLPDTRVADAITAGGTEVELCNLSAPCEWIVGATASLSAGGRTINLPGPIITEGTVVSGIGLVAALNQQCSPIQESPTQSQPVVPKLNCAIFQRVANGSWVQLQLHRLSAGGRTINLSGPIITEGTVVSGIDLVAALNQQCR
jgi:hypothetical protein